MAGLMCTSARSEKAGELAGDSMPEEKEEREAAKGVGREWYNKPKKESKIRRPS